jgi:hypothetical protein
MLSKVVVLPVQNFNYWLTNMANLKGGQGQQVPDTSKTNNQQEIEK